MSRALKFGEVLDYQENSRRKNVDKMLEALISWDMTEPDGTPVPLTVEGYDSLDWAQGVEILNAWTDTQMGNLSEKKAKNSGNGQALDPDMPMPMETL